MLQGPIPMAPTPACAAACPYFPPSALVGITARMAPLNPPITDLRIMNFAVFGTPSTKTLSRMSERTSNSFMVGSFTSFDLIHFSGLVLSPPSGISSPIMFFSPVLTPLSYNSSSNSFHKPVGVSNISSFLTCGPGRASFISCFIADPSRPMPRAPLNLSASNLNIPFPAGSFIASLKAFLMYTPTPL